MPALPTAVTDYLTSVKNSLTVGSDLGSGLRAAAQNYLRAQDMASVLDLLQEALTQPNELTTTASGTTTTVVDGAGTFVVNSQIGNYVVFADDTTTASLQGVSARIKSNTATTLTLETALPAATALGDTYTIRGAMFEEFIADLRQGKGRGDAPTGDVYGDHRIAYAAIVKGIQNLGGSVPSRTPAQILVHPGAQPGENAFLAYLIDTLQTAVVGFTLPT